MKTNAYSSDFGLNKQRVDILLDQDNGVTTILDVINLVLSGETFIKAKLKSNHDRCYTNNLCKALRSIGIADIRYGVAGSVYVSQSNGYTLYK